MDILFKNDDFVFSYRVGGILIRNGKILLQRPKNDDYSIIGGHVAAMETSIETLKREFEEELHTKIEVDNLQLVKYIFHGVKDHVIRYVYIIMYISLIMIFL